jgi:hypothetical protein
MTPKKLVPAVDQPSMTLGFFMRRSGPPECAHPSIVRTEIAGMSREVCTQCGQVNVGYVTDHYSARKISAPTQASPTADAPK